MPNRLYLLVQQRTLIFVIFFALIKNRKKIISPSLYEISRGIVLPKAMSLKFSIFFWLEHKSNFDFTYSTIIIGDVAQLEGAEGEVSSC